MTSTILHFGVGNFHRSHQAKYLHDLHALGRDLDWRIVGAGLLPADERMREALREQGYTYTLVERSADGTDSVHRIATIRDYLYGPDDPEALIDALADADTRVVSMTITEGGYNLSDTTGRFDTRNPLMRSDMWMEDRPSTVFGYLAAGLRRRRALGRPPFTVMSCDNIQNNGEMAREALTAFIGMSDSDLAAWTATSGAFPSSMVDRITPVTTDVDREWVSRTTGFDEPWPVISEDYTQWVIEDDFPSGRPRWEDVGAQLVAEVAPFETMKLRMLNGAHQAVAYLGLLSGFTYVHDAIADPSIRAFVDGFVREAQDTVPPISGVDLDEYRALLLERFSNSAIRDTLARLATDTSDRIPKFVVPSARDILLRGRCAPFTAAVIASWVALAERGLRSGRPLPDRQAPAVEASILDERINAGSFLENAHWFGELSSSEPFRDHYVALLAQLRDDDPRSILRGPPPAGRRQAPTPFSTRPMPVPPAHPNH